MTQPTAVDPSARERALKRVKKRREFAKHLLVYVLLNSAVVLIWALTTSGGFFWPVFLIAFWGIGLIMSAWDLWHGDDVTEDEIDREIERMSRRR